MSESNNNTESLINFAKETVLPDTITAKRGTSTETNVAFLPMGLKAVSLKPYLDEYLTRPERVKGVATLSTLAGFVAHVRRSARPESAIFADTANRQLVAVYDYHTPAAEGLAGWCQHSAVYPFPMSRAWKAWAAIDGKQMDQGTLAEFVENHAHEVIDPKDDAAKAAGDSLTKLDLRVASPSQVLTLSRGLEINVSSKIVESKVLATGDTRVIFEEKASGSNGAPLDVPGGFVVAIPVFDGDAPFALAVRLRLKVREGRITYTLALLGAEDAMRAAFDEAIKRVASETGVATFDGTPER